VVGTCKKSLLCFSDGCFYGTRAIELEDKNYILYFWIFNPINLKKEKKSQNVVFAKTVVLVTFLVETICPAYFSLWHKIGHFSFSEG